MMRMLMTACIASVATMPVVAQDIPSPYDGAVAEQGQRQLQDTLAKRRLQQAQQRQPRSDAEVSASARATCRNKRTVAARLGAAKARQLYALCARAGY